MTAPKGPRHALLEGWILLGWAALVLAIVVPATLAVRGTDLAGVRAGLAVTGRLSAGLFLGVFAASALARLWPAAPARWLLRNRRHLGVAFALSHTTHLALIGAMVPLDASRFVEQPASLIPGIVAYLFVFALGATSTDRTAAWLSARAWRRLHRTGVWVIWLVFTAAYLQNAFADPLAAAATALLLAAAALRAAVWLRTRRRRRRLSR
jgi:methionine sulfoxide reductase heme-binding subunit